MFDVVLGEIVSANVIDIFIASLLSNQGGPRRFRVSNSVSSTVSQTKELGLDLNSRYTCTNNYKEKLKFMLTSNREIFWPIRVNTKCGKGHWILAMVYPTLRTITTIDSSLQIQRLKKIHKVVDFIFPFSFIETSFLYCPSNFISLLLHDRPCQIS